MSYPRNRPFHPLAALSLIVAAALAACGGGDDDAASVSVSLSAPVAAQAAAVDPSAEVVSGLRRRALALQAAGVPASEAARQLMDHAETVYPQYFPGHPATAQSAPFDYRHYPATQVYLGVAVAGGSSYAENGVYVMGGSFGAAPLYVGQLTDFITPVDKRITLALGSDKAVVTQGGSSSTALTLTRAEGFVAGAQVQVDGLPAGVSARPLVVPEGGTSATLVLDAAASAPHSLPTSTTVTLRAGDAVVTRTLDVTVRGVPGTPDTTFGGGSIVTPVGVSEDYANAVAVQADGKVLVAGSTATNKGTQFSIVRHLRDGGLDPSFGTGGKVVLPVGTRGNDVVAALAVQPDGRIVMAGSSEQGPGRDRHGRGAPERRRPARRRLRQRRHRGVRLLRRDRPRARRAAAGRRRHRGGRREQHRPCRRAGLRVAAPERQRHAGRGLRPGRQGGDRRCAPTARRSRCAR